MRAPELPFVARVRRAARQAAVLATVVVGVVGTVATSYDPPLEPLAVVASPERTLVVTVSEAAPNARFRVGATASRPVGVTLVVDASVIIDDDDGSASVDVGALEPGGELPLELTDEGRTATVTEGGVATVGTVIDGAGTVAVRLRPGEATASVELRLRAESTLAAADAEDLTLSLTVDPE